MSHRERSLRPPSYTRLALRPSTRSEWAVERPWTYESPRETVIVPAGFLFDGASVPRLLRWFAQPMEPVLLAAALLHDFLYRTRPLFKGENAYPFERPMRRIDADRLFLRVLLEDGERVLRAYVLFLAVRLGGWWAWRKRSRSLPAGTGMGGGSEGRLT